MKPAAKILVVEDEAIVALDLERQLARLGYQSVGITSRAEDAVQMAADLRPDLILMDVHLAGAMDGIEAAVLIRQRYSIASVFLTAYATHEVVERAKRAEPLGYVIKPFDEYNLRTAIEMALHKDHSERQLRESEAQYRAVAQSAALQTAALRAAANAIVITNRNGKIEWVNPAFSELTQYSVPEAIGRSPRELLRSGEHTQEFYAQMWDTIVSGRVWDGELINRRKDGTTYAEHQTITPVTDADGAISHFIGVKRDLTQERRLQAQYVQAQKMEVVGRLAGGIAHDFNNLLTIINGESELACMTLPDADPIRIALERILEAGERAARLTRQLLTFSRKQLTTPSLISARKQVQEFAPMLRRLIGEDITLSLNIDDADRLDHVLIDKSQLEQVILNLAVNARDAMPHGGTLNIRTGLHIANALVLISVTDTGTGIPPEIKDRLFEPFFTTKPQDKGTGLGLATSFDIVSRCGGTISVESEFGNGATFHVSLPLAELPAVRPDETAAERSGGRETIVLVEDEADLRDLAARMLRAVGYAVIPMESGGAALDWFADREHTADVLLTDVVMPVMTGPELATAVHRDRRELPVLFASGYTDEKLTAEAIQNPDHFIAKPYTAAELARKVRRVLDMAAPH